MPRPDYEIMAKGFLKAIKDYGDIQAEQFKLKTAILANTFKAKQNFFWKMQEKNYQTDYQKNLQRMFEQQQGGGGGIAPEEDVFATPVQPEIGMGVTGYQTRTPNIREWVYKRIQLKKNKYKETGDIRFKPSEKEMQFETRYLMGPSSEAGNLFPEDGTVMPHPEEPYTPESQTYTNWNDINLPDNITTTGDALKYLQENNNMDEDEARQYLQSRYLGQ